MARPYLFGTFEIDRWLGRSTSVYKILHLRAHFRNFHIFYTHHDNLFSKNVFFSWSGNRMSFQVSWEPIFLLLLDNKVGCWCRSCLDPIKTLPQWNWFNWVERRSRAKTGWWFDQGDWLGASDHDTERRIRQGQKCRFEFETSGWASIGSIILIDHAITISNR
jgi:hypothetical protein